MSSTSSTSRCSVDRCENPTKARGLCNKHYQRWLRHGDATTRIRYNNSGQCKIRGCTAPARSRQLCQAHYLRWLKSQKECLSSRSE